jgi:hypothetical protein
MRNAPSGSVALFDRRKGYGASSMDRRRTYVDIMERVLGSDAMFNRPRQRSLFTREIDISPTAIGLAVASVEVRILDSIADKR